MIRSTSSLKVSRTLSAIPQGAPQPCITPILFPLATNSVFWGNICFHELPQYKAVEWNPDCGKARWVFLGDADVEYMYRHYGYQMHNLRPGKWPEKTYMSELPQWDPSYGPPGKYVPLVAEGHPPPASYLTEKEWMQVRREVGERFINEWQKNAPNMTWDNVIDVNIPTPLDIA